MILDDLCHQSRYRASDTRNQVHHLSASGFAFERAFNPIDLTAYAPDARQEVLLFFDRVRHELPNGIGGYPISRLAAQLHAMGSGAAPIDRKVNYEAA